LLSHTSDRASSWVRPYFVGKTSSVTSRMKLNGKVVFRGSPTGRR
jgi:hypothetical protein